MGKILFFGSIKDNNKYSVAFKKIVKINKSKNGPFDMAICSGSFLEDKNLNDNDLLQNIKLLMKNNAFFNGNKKLPIPVVFFGSKRLDKIFDEEEDEKKIKLPMGFVFLGSNSINTVKDIKIGAFYTDETTTVTDTIRFSNLSENHEYLDVLLTNKFPKKLFKKLPAKDYPNFIQEAGDFEEQLEAINTLGDENVYEIVKELNFRYHLMPSYVDNKYYQRAPFRSADNKKIISRVLMLSYVGNKLKEKWLFAISIDPINEGTDIQVPNNATTSPFLTKTSLLNKRKASSSSSSSSSSSNNNNNNLEPSLKKKKLNDNSVVELPDAYKAFGSIHYDIGPNAQKKYQHNNNNNYNQNNNKKRFNNNRKKETIGDCWFCLSSPQVESHLITSIGDESYIALAKGGLSDHHSLIVPIFHATDAIIDLNEEIQTEITKYKKALIDCFEKKDQKVVFFERNVTTRFGRVHSHIQCVPIDNNLVDDLVGEYVKEATKHHIKLEIVEKDDDFDLKEQLAGLNGYFYAELPNGVKVIHKITHPKQRHPMQYGRTVLANVMNIPEKINWKNCSKTKPEEETLAENFKTLFADYDIAD